MTRICLTEFLGHTELYWQHCDPTTSLDAIQADAVLRIGDAALLTNPGGREVVDMGALWSEHTSLPFVYAAWLAPVGTPAEPLGEVLAESHRMGTGALQEAARDFARLHAMSAQLSVEYLTKHIRFDLGDREREGLKLFGKLAHKLGLVDRAELPEPLD